MKHSPGPESPSDRRTVPELPRRPKRPAAEWSGFAGAPVVIAAPPPGRRSEAP